ncbi:MAG: Flp family type IVb pilin [Syntrophomonadales bacterium]
MLEKLKQLVIEEQGQGMVEYGLILALIAIVVIVALTDIGENIKDVFEDIGGKLNGLSE